MSSVKRAFGLDIFGKKSQDGESLGLSPPPATDTNGTENHAGGSQTASQQNPSKKPEAETPNARENGSELASSGRLPVLSIASKISETFEDANNGKEASSGSSTPKSGASTPPSTPSTPTSGGTPTSSSTPSPRGTNPAPAPSPTTNASSSAATSTKESAPKTKKTKKKKEKKTKSKDKEASSPSSASTKAKDASSPSSTTKDKDTHKNVDQKHQEARPSGRKFTKSFSMLRGKISEAKGDKSKTEEGTSSTSSPSADSSKKEASAPVSVPSSTSTSSPSTSRAKSPLSGSPSNSASSDKLRGITPTSAAATADKKEQRTSTGDASSSTDDESKSGSDTDFARRSSAGSGGGRKSLSVVGRRDSVGIFAWDDETEMEEEVPYPFDVEDSSENVVFSEEPETESQIVCVKAGTLQKLVERLTYEKYPDTVYVSAFLLTYRSFTTPTELLGLLIARYNVPTPKGASEEEAQQYNKNKVNIRLRVFNVLKTWLSKHFYDFQEDKQLLATLQRFIEKTMMTTGAENPAIQLQQIIKKKLEGQETERKKQFNTDPPRPILLANLATDSLGVMSLDAIEMARQLTLIEHHLYCNIKPQECVGQAWTNKATRDKNAPNIMAMIERFNAVSRWVSTEILKTEDMKERASVLTKFLDIAQGMKELNNYNGMMEIISGLQSSAVYRLKHTWALVNKSHMKRYKEILELMSRDNNFQRFREHLHKVDPPCLPYLGVYLTDLTFTEDGNKDYVEPHGLINFEKRRMVWQVIREIQQYQDKPYCLEEIEFIKQYLANASFLDENEMYRLSLEREPKNMPPPPSPSWRARFLKTKDKKASTKNVKNAGDKEGGEEDASHHKEDEEEFGELELPQGYPFYQPDSKEHLVFDIDFSSMIADLKPNIKAATLAKLIEKLTHESYPEPSQVNCFLLTFHAYCDPFEIIRLLKLRFEVPVPKDKNEELQKKYHDTKTVPIRLRVFNLAKTWADKYYNPDYMKDEKFVREFHSLADLMIANGMEKTGETLKRALERQIQGDTSSRQIRLIGEAPKPKLPAPKNDNPDVANDDPSHYLLTDFDNEEIARQMALVEQKLVGAVKPWELCKQAWMGPDAEKKAPNVKAVEAHAQRMRDWVATEIVRCTSVEDAAATITKFVKVAEQCMNLNNFMGMEEIVSALMLPDVAKLKTVWNNVSSKNTFKQMKALLDDNYVKLLDKLHRVQPPCVPCLGSFLKQLASIEEKNPDMVDGLINFEKATMIGDVITDFGQYQQTYYCLQEVPLIQEYMRKADVFAANQIAELASFLSAKKKKTSKEKQEKEHNNSKDKDARTSSAGDDAQAPSPEVQAKLREMMESADAGGDPAPARRASVSQSSASPATTTTTTTTTTSSSPSNTMTRTSSKKLAKLFGGSKPEPPPFTATAGGGSAPVLVDTSPTFGRRHSVNPPLPSPLSTGSVRSSVPSSQIRGDSQEFDLNATQLKCAVLAAVLDDKQFRDELRKALMPEVDELLQRHRNEVLSAVRKELDDFKASILAAIAAGGGGGSGASSSSSSSSSPSSPSPLSSSPTTAAPLPINSKPPVPAFAPLPALKLPGRPGSAGTTADAVRKKFPGKIPTPCKLADSSEEASLYKVESPGEPIVLVDVKTDIRESDVDAMVRWAEVYSKQRGNVTVTPCLIGEWRQEEGARWTAKHPALRLIRL